MTNATKMHMANWTKMVVSENGGGTGNITLGAVNGYPTIADTLGTGKSFHYVFRAVNNTPIEAGVGVMIDAVTLRRDTVYAKIVNGIYSAGALTAGNIAVGSLLYTADTKEMLQDLVREGLEFNYGDVSGNTTVNFNYACIRANLTADTTITVDADTLPPAGTHHEIILKLKSNNNPALTTPFQAGFLLTLAGGRFFIDGGVTAYPSMRLLGAAGSEMTLRLTNIAGGTNYRVENISKHEHVHNMGVLAGNITLDIRRPWNIAELTGSGTTATINAISPDVAVLEPAHFTIVNNGSVTKTVFFDSNILSIAGSLLSQVTLPIGYKVDFDIRRNPINSAISYEAKIGEVNYNQTANRLATSWNPSDYSGSPPLTLSNSNKTINLTTKVGASVYRSARAFGAKNSGKHFFTIRMDLATLIGSNSASNMAGVSVGLATAALSLSTHVGQGVNSGSLLIFKGTTSTCATWVNGASTSRASPLNAVISDLVTVAFNASNGKCWFIFNNTILYGGDPENDLTPAFTLSPGFYLPMISMAEQGTSESGEWTLLDEVQALSVGALIPSFNYWTA